MSTAGGYGVFKHQVKNCRVLSLFKLANNVNTKLVAQSWQQESDNALVSQPLLLPIMLTLSKEQADFAKQQLSVLNHAGIHFLSKDNNKVQVRQFPAVLREQDVSRSFIVIIDFLLAKSKGSANAQYIQQDFIQAIASAMVLKEYNKRTR